MQENEWEYIFNVAADCVLTPTYCNTGTCTEDTHSVYCTCPDNFEGVRCQAKSKIIYCFYRISHYNNIELEELDVTVNY